ncbi:MAG: hypothetical protein R6U27_14485 [Desulfobacterales bacterium]
MDSNWDIVLKIEKLDETLNTVDNLVAEYTGSAEKLPGTVLRSMLQGTDWIDPQRCIVFATKLKEPQPVTFALVPFRKPNETFKTIFNAVAADNYYLLPIGPFQQAGISKDDEKLLHSLSRKQFKRSVSLEFFINQLLKKNDRQIREMLLNMQQNQGISQEGEQQFSAEETQKIINNMMDAATQVETLSMGLDLAPETITASMEIQSMEKTVLEKLFTPGTQKTILRSYNPAYPIAYKMAAYDIMGMLNLVDQVFGAVYETLGLNFNELISIAAYFTGETAGGINYNRTGSSIESISVFKKAQASPDFFENIFFPWLKKYSKNMQQMMEPQSDDKIKQLFTRTQDSQVLGYHVVGVNIEIPLLPEDNGSLPESASDLKTISYGFRMTVVDNLLLIAPDDTRLKELIETGKQLEPEFLIGPMAWFKVDLTSYFSALKNMIPQLSGPDPMPDMGKIGYTVDMKKGQFKVDSIIKVRDLQNMIRYMKSISAEESELHEKSL